MPIVELVKDSQVKALPAPHPSGKPVLFFAEDMPGFAVLVSGVGATKTYVAQRDLPGGRSRRVKIARCNFLPLKEARQRAAQMLLRIEAGDDPKAAKKVLARGAVTLQKVFADYLVDNPNLRPASVRNYRAYLRYLEDWMDQPIKTIDRDAVERRHRQIAKEVAGRGRGSIGAGSANSAMRVLRILWNHAADHPERYGVIPANPVRLGKAWLPEPRREGRVNDGDLAKFYSGIMALKNDIGRNFLTMLLFTGLRLTEAASLRWDNISFPERTITVRAEVTKAGRRLVLPMSDVVMNMLVRRRKLGNATFVFPARGRAGHLVEVKYFFAEIAASTGVKVTAHDLRRTYARAARACGLDLYGIKLLLNHSVKSDVTAGYIGGQSEDMAPQIQAIANHLKRLCNIESSTAANIVQLAK